jgi:hypothetical protein
MSAQKEYKLLSGHLHIQPNPLSALHILKIRLWHVPDIDPKTDSPQIAAILQREILI